MEGRKSPSSPKPSSKPSPPKPSSPDNVPASTFADSLLLQRKSPTTALRATSPKSPAVPVPTLLPPPPPPLSPAALPLPSTATTSLSQSSSEASLVAAKRKRFIDVGGQEPLGVNPATTINIFPSDTTTTTTTNRSETGSPSAENETLRKKRSKHSHSPRPIPVSQQSALRSPSSSPQPGNYHRQAGHHRSPSPPRMLEQHRHHQLPPGMGGIAEPQFMVMELDTTEQELELDVVAKMKEFRERNLLEHGPYSSLDLPRLLNPPDRVEAIALHSSTRHGTNSLHYESVALNAMDLIESEQELVRMLNRVATIVQGDAPDWQEVPFDDFDETVVQCRDVLQKLVNFYTISVEKIQDIRDKTTFVHARKKEFLAHLVKSFRPAPTQPASKPPAGATNGSSTSSRRPPF